LDLSSEEMSVLGKKCLSSLGLSLDLGTEFTWDSVQYKVIGRLLFEDSWKENITDYLLFHPFKGSRWLSEYDGSYSISIPSHVWPVEQPFSCTKGSTISTYDGEKWRYKEIGKLMVVYVDGAMPWVAKIGDSLKYVEFTNTRNRRQLFEVQQALTSGSEMEFGIVRSLTSKEMTQALGSAQIKRLNVSMVFEKSIMGKALSLMSILCFLFFIGKISQSTIDPVTELSFSAEELNQEILSKSFSIKDINKPVKLEIASNISNAWMALDLAVLKVPQSIDELESYDSVVLKEAAFPEENQSKVIYLENLNISFYYGSSGGESWSEGSRSQEVLLMLPEIGEYRIMTHAVSGDVNPHPFAMYDVQIKIFENVEILRYYYFMIILSVGLFFIGRKR
jgi:hypothetical protein